MATLVLTTIGTAIGGPLGGALGALLGQAADARLFSPKGRTGPRLDELRVQTSSYGSAIPQLFGRMRVSGTVIWSTDLVERRNRQSNGKGRGSSTTYSYSVSLAVALSSRPIVRVGRIWAEGNILRGSAGDFKSPTGFRLHRGGEDQAVDPLIAAAETAGQCPAYRGIAYAVFEDFDLTPFGNRVPSLTFEVEADDAPLTFADPVAAMLSPSQASATIEPLVGCALAGSVGDALGGLAAAVRYDRRPGERMWQIGERGGDAAVLTQPMVDGAREPGARSEAMRSGADTVPQRVVIESYDPARDFQTGIQHARVPGGGGGDEQVALPVAMTADDAKAMAARLSRERALTTARWREPQGFAALAIAPGDAVIRAPGGTRLIVEERRIAGAGVELQLRGAPASVPATPGADSGRAVVAPDLAIGASIAQLFDLPSMDSSDRVSGRTVLAATGSGAGWRSASVSVRPTAAGPAIAVGSVGRAAVLGVVESVDTGGGCLLLDTQRAIVVALAAGSADLINASDADLLGGANLAAVGDELIQFGRAEPLGAGRWRLTRLLRGRLGTEDAVAGTATGDGFVLIDEPSLLRIGPEAYGGGFAGGNAGALVEIEGQGDLAPVTIALAGTGRATVPLSPVHGQASWRDDGGLLLSWVRRSRDGFAWVDGVDAPLDERSERYRLRLTGGSIVEVRECDAAALLLTAAEVADWRATGAMLVVAIVQSGERGESAVLTCTVPI